MTLTSSRGREKLIVDRIFERLKLINGTGNYYTKLKEENVFRTFKNVDQVKQYPSVCIGAMSIILSKDRPRNMFQVPFKIDVWGYLLDAKSNDPCGESMKLLSDFRLAIGEDEFLNSQINHYTFDADVGAIEQFGFVRFGIGGQFEYKLTSIE